MKPVSNTIINQISKLSALVKNGNMEKDIRWESFSRVFIREIKKAKLYVDCGAEFGFYIHLVEEFGPIDCKIMAYEPEPPRYEALKGYFKSHSKVEIFPYAVSNRNRAINIYKTDGKSASIDKNLTQWGEVDKVSISVMGCTLDKFMINQNPDIIKMDIEGAEVLALQGAKQILKQIRPLIFLEYHPRFVESVTSNGEEILFDLLEESTYAIRNHKGTPCDLNAGRVILVPHERVASVEFD